LLWPSPLTLPPLLLSFLFISPGFRFLNVFLLIPPPLFFFYSSLLIPPTSYFYLNGSYAEPFSPKGGSHHSVEIPKYHLFLVLSIIFIFFGTCSPSNFSSFLSRNTVPRPDTTCGITLRDCNFCLTYTFFLDHFPLRINPLTFHRNSTVQPPARFLGLPFLPFLARRVCNASARRFISGRLCRRHSFLTA